ncbi:ArsC family reductase [Castellaniella hirudinis]|uniref:ArsC family reductase n=1 Tax=Castellaniella hirudinis TaxID=1144617 RepID=A0ABV8RX65_9BURK
MSLILYGIPNCDTVKKARAWLDARQQPYQFHDFKKAGVPEARLPQWIAQTGWEKLINRQGTTWRKLPPELQAQIQDAAGATRLMRDQASLIKRPVVEWPDGSVTVGFNETAWAEKL